MQYAITLLFSLLLVSSAAAAPGKPSISGTVSDGQQITISGSSFGTKSPAAPYFWDRVDNQSAYSGLSNGATVPVGSSYPWLNNNGNSTDHEPVKYNTSSPQRGSRTANYLSGKASGGSTSNASAMTLGMPSPTHVDSNRYYVSWWMRREHGSVSASNKYMRMNSHSSWPGSYQASWTDNVGCYIYNVDSSAYVTGTTTSNVSDHNTWPDWPAQNTWGRMEMLMNSTTPALTSGMIGGTYDTLTSSGGMTANLSYVDGLGWDVDQSVTGGVYWGEVYIDTTWARIELCNSSTWGARTHCEIQIPSAWSTTSATATVNAGTFTAGSTAYLYVIDSTGAVSPASDPLTIGSGSSNITCYPDADGDLYPGSGSESVTTCSANHYIADHFTAMTADCNDSNSAIHPGETDVCGNSVDEDCSGADATCAAATGHLRASTGAPIRAYGGGHIGVTQ